LRLCDGVRDVEQIAVSLGIRGAKVRRILGTLAERGAVVALAVARERGPVPRALLDWARGGSAAPASTADESFSGDEESFFAAPIPEEPAWEPDDR
jgi:hypothetical protein